MDDRIVKQLLLWYDYNQRQLPWRESATVYHVWLSEIMSQQTRIETVVDYYVRFIDAFPDVYALAEATEDEVLKLWEGLGYYRRAKNLYRTAKIVVEEYSGHFPKTAIELKKLPGIGDYTSAAIASIVWGELVPAIDGNLLRVFARLAAYEEEILSSKAKKMAHKYFIDRMPEDRPGDFNQALMELGATLCVPKGIIDCDSCPCKAVCLAYKEGKQALLPFRASLKARKIEEKTVLLLRYEDKIVVRQRPRTGLLASLYEFPSIEGIHDEMVVLSLLDDLGIEINRINPLPPQKHIFSHLEWHMTGYDVLLEKPLSQDALVELGTEGDAVFVTIRDMALDLSIPTAFSYFRKHVLVDSEV